VSLAKELRLVEAKLMVELEDRRNGAFADADGADRLGFDENDPPAVAAHEPRKRSRGHPPGGSAPNNDNAPDRPSFSHGPSLGLLSGELEAA
jgi:hypothetical protein